MKEVGEYDLDALAPDQRAIAEASPDSRLLVTAGPGTGKTHTLISRLAYLSETHDLGPGEILVLSFTRAAVRVIKERVTAGGGNVRSIRAATFDSFATRLLADFDPAGRWVDADYEGRIEAAISLIETDNEIPEELASYKHFIVDEMQDLVGVRADLVRSLLSGISCGFTLLGDPAQGIYNFQLEGEERKVGSAALYEWVRDWFPDELTELSLKENYRALSEVSKLALFAGPLLNSPEPDYADIRDRLLVALGTIPEVGGLGVASGVLRNSKQPSAILCRTNGEALCVSKYLWDKGIDHRLQRSASERAVNPWIGKVLGPSELRSMGKAKFLRRMEEMAPDGAPAPDLAWRLLKRLDRQRTEDIDLGRIAERIRVGNIPDELADVQPTKAVVSTIHRAKGLEFDNVFLIRPRSIDMNEIEEAEEARVLYVAMTRPRTELIPIDGPDIDGRLHIDNESARWTIRSWNNNWMLWGFEVTGEDLDSEYPAGGHIAEDHPTEIQDYLLDEVAAGDSVTLNLIESARNVGQVAYYEARHKGRFIGITSERFARKLFKAIRANRACRGKWPEAIEDLRIEGVDTVAGTEVTTRRCGLGASGIWLRARPVGLGKVVWAKGKEPS